MTRLALSLLNIQHTKVTGMRDESLLYSNLLGSCSDRGYAVLPISTRLRQIDKRVNISFMKYKKSKSRLRCLAEVAPKMSTNPWPARPSPRKKTTNGKLRCDWCSIFVNKQDIANNRKGMHVAAASGWEALRHLGPRLRRRP